MPTLTTYACQDYFLARVPDFQNILPTYPIPTAIQAAIALYWDRFIPQVTGLWVTGPLGPSQLVPPPIDETLLTDRQKVLASLRAVLGCVPAFTKALTNPRVTDAKGGPAEAKFEELNKLLKVLLPQWQVELKNLEAFEGIFFDLLPNIPAYLLPVPDCTFTIGNQAAWIYDPATASWALSEV